MARRTSNLNVELEVNFIPISDGEMASLRSGISLMLTWLREAEKFLDVDVDCENHQTGTSQCAKVSSEHSTFEEL